MLIKFLQRRLRLILTKSGSMNSKKNHKKNNNKFFFCKKLKTYL